MCPLSWRGRRGNEQCLFSAARRQAAGYLDNQLIAFRNGRRRYPPMNYLLAYLSEDYLVLMANYFASQTPPLPAPAVPDVSKDVLAHGEPPDRPGRLQPGHPGLLELPRPFADRHGAGDPRPARPARRLYQRPARRLAIRHPHRPAPDCMQVVAGHMTEDDVRRSRPARRPAGGAGSLACPERQLRPALSLREPAAMSPMATLLKSRCLRPRRCCWRPRASPGPAQAHDQAAGRAPSSSPRASISPAPATASPVTPRRRGRCLPAARRCRRRSARSIPRTSRPTPRPASANGPPTNSTR